MTPPTLFASRRRDDRAQLRVASCATPSASCSCSAAGWRSRARLVLIAFGGPVRRASSTCRSSSTSTTRRWPRSTASRSCRSCPTAASSPTATASCSRRATRRTRSRSRRRAIRNLEATIDELADDRRHPAARPQALPQAARRVEELREPAAAHAPDRRGGRALRRQPLPLPRRRDQGAAVPPVSVRRSRRRTSLGYIGRINDKRRRAHRRVGRDRQLQGLRLHRQGRRRAFLRARAARHDRRRGGRGRCRRPRGAHAVAHAADLGQQPAPVARHPAAAGGRGGVRRPARRAGRDRACDRRRAGVRLQARLRPEPLRRRHRPGELGGAERVARQAAPEPPAARRVSARLDDQAVPRARRAHLGQAHAARSRSPIPASSRSPATRTASATTSRAATASVDMYKSIVVSCDTYYYVLASETDIDDTARFLSQLGFGRQDRARHRGRADRHAAVARVEAHSASPARTTATIIASGISATRSRRASGRATTRSRRCSSRTRPRSSRTTASRTGRTSSSSVVEPEDRRRARDRARADAHARR